MKSDFDTLLLAPNLAVAVCAFALALMAPLVAFAEPTVARKLNSAPLPASAPVIDPNSIARVPRIQLEWSKNPGVYEGDLRRRFENPLYVEPRRKVDEQQLQEAKRNDARRMWVVLDEFIDLLSKKRSMSKLQTASEMADALLQIDEATWKALRVGGEAYNLAAGIQKMRKQLMKDWRASSAADPGVKALLDAEERIPAVNPNSRAIRFLALIQAESVAQGQGPIRKQEFATALLSEDPDSIRNIYNALRGDLKTTMNSQLTLLLADVGRENIAFAGKDRKVAVVAKLLQVDPARFGISIGSSSL